MAQLYRDLCGGGTFHDGQEGDRARSTFGNPAFLGSFLAMTTPLAIVALKSNANRTKIIGALASGTGLIALYLSFTRGAWLAALFVVPIAIFAGFKWAKSGRRRSLAPVIGIATFMIIAAALIVPGKLSSGYGLARLESATNLTSGTTGTRLEMWRGAAALIRERPIFGWGPVTFRDNFLGTEKLSALESVFRRADRPHNHFLYLAFALGLGGAAAYYLFATGLIWAAMTSEAARSTET